MNPNTASLLAIIISSFSLLVAAFALGWTIYRDCIDKGKLKVYAYIADVYYENTEKAPQVFSVQVTNIGKKPIIINGHEFLHKDGKKSRFPDVMQEFSNKKLEPYEVLNVTMSNAILKTMIERADKFVGFAVYDTKGKRWSLKEKVFKEISASLKEKQVLAANS